MLPKHFCHPLDGQALRNCFNSREKISNLVDNDREKVFWEVNY